MKLTRSVLAALLAALLFAAPAAATTIDVPPATTTHVDSSGMFGTSYSLAIRFQANTAMTINKIGIYHGGVGDTAARSMHLWTPDGPSNGAEAIYNGTLPATQTTGMQWLDLSSSNITLQTNDYFQVGYDQPSGARGVHWRTGLIANGGIPAAGGTFGQVLVHSSYYRNSTGVPYSTNLNDSGWSVGSYWYIVAVQVTY